MRGSPTARRTLDRALEFFGRGNAHFDSDRFSRAADCYRRARDEFMRIYRVLHHEIGMSPKEAEKFLAKGMLINTVLGMRLTDVMEAAPDVQELLECIFTQEEAQTVADLISGYEPLPPAARGRTSS